MSETNIEVKEPRDFIEALKENTKPQVIEVDEGTEAERKLLLVPDGMTAKSVKSFLDEYRLTPERRKGTARVDRLQSFIDLTNRFKSHDSVLFAQATINENKISAHIQAIFDYHPAGADVKDADNAGHRVRYDFPISKDFAFWLKNNAQGMGQSDFALFLEERVIDMVAYNDEDRAKIEGLKPHFADPLQILEMSRDLELNATESVKQKMKLASGETEVAFTSTHTDSTGKPVKIPDFFVIRMPIFEGGGSERILVRLRYRLMNQKITWFYDLYRVDMVLNDAFENDCQYAQEQTDLPLYFGKPEGIRDSE